MSDYGSRSYGSGSGENGWDGSGRDSRGFGDSYDDYAPRQRGDSGYGDSGYSSGGGAGGGYGSGGYGDSGYGDGGSGGGSGYGDGYGSAGSDSYGVRSASPHDEPVTSGRARVPGGDSTGPGRARGSARVGGKRASGLSEEESEGMKKAKKKKKRRRRLIAMTCVLVMFLGIGTVVGTLFFENVPLPEEIQDELARNTTITYAGGKEMGKIGTDQGNRTMVNVRKDGKVKDDNDVPKEVQNVLLAMEDRNFYKHDGVDFWGVMRAFVNNVTGGETQGASTLTQQYVGTVSKIREDTSYLRKAKEAVMAMKMDDEYEKYEIIEHYLNLVYMGRGSYGLGAATKAWFGDDKKVSELTASEAAIIFAQVKSPDSTFDPTKTEAKDKTAKLEERWEYALNGMVEEGWMKKAKAEKYLKKFPKDDITDTYSVSANSGMTDPTGFVSHGQVIEEAEENYDLSYQDIQTNGYKIETTINPTLQKIAEKVAKKKKGTAMGDEQKNLLGALVAINPRNGEVVAYYGGNHDGSTSDKAAEVHAQGSSFKEVTVSAAIKHGWGPESRWDGSSPRKFDEREVSNSGDGRGANKPDITLRDATVQSLNTPMYKIATEVGANTIVKLARDMGVEVMQVPEVGCEGDDCPHIPYPLTGDSKKAKTADKAINSDNPRSFADNEVSFGQFPVSVVDMAAINATLAAEGTHRETHFIKKITKPDGEVLEPVNKLENKVALDQSVARDVTDILTGVHPNYLSGNTFSNGRTYAAKSGTWERFCDPACDENASTSFTGYVPDLAAAAWVGDKKNENGSVKTADGGPAYGAAIAGEVWAMFMQEAVTAKGFDSMKPFEKGPGGKGKLESPDHTGGDEGDEGDEGDDGGEGGDECEENPELPQCGGETPPTCEEAPTDPTCTGTPDCFQNPNHPQCGGGESPDCSAIPRPPECDDFAQDRIRPEHERLSERDQYAVREDYRRY